MLVPAAQVPPAMAKSALAPRLIDDGTRAALPVLASVTFCAALLDPIGVAAKASAIGGRADDAGVSILPTRFIVQMEGVSLK